LTSPIRFAGSPQGFGAAELGFKGRQPWEEEGERKNVRKRGGSVRRKEGAVVKEGLAGWAFSPAPIIFSFSNS